MSNSTWTKGKSANPTGRPKGAKTKWGISDLKRALAKAAKGQDGKSLLESMCERAYKNDRIAVAILKKMLPDLKMIDAVVEYGNKGYSCLTPSDAAEQMDDATIGEKPE